MSLMSLPTKLLRPVLLPIADGFNFLLSGVARVEKSIAAGTQLYSLVTGAWSDRLLTNFHLPHELLPPLVERVQREAPGVRRAAERAHGVADMTVARGAGLHASTLHDTSTRGRRSIGHALRLPRPLQLRDVMIDGHQAGFAGRQRQRHAQRDRQPSRGRRDRDAGRDVSRRPGDRFRLGGVAKPPVRFTPGRRDRNRLRLPARA